MLSLLTSFLTQADGTGGHPPHHPKGNSHLNEESYSHGWEEAQTNKTVSLKSHCWAAPKRM